MSGNNNCTNPEKNKETDLKALNPVAMLLDSPTIRKTDIDAMSDLLVDQILEETNGMGPFVVFEALKKVCENVNARLRKEIELRGAVTIKGVKLEEASVARTFNYAMDPEYVRLKALVDARAALLKQQYEIKTNPMNFGKEVPGIIGEGGEEIPFIEVKSGGGTTIKCTFPK